MCSTELFAIVHRLRDASWLRAVTGLMLILAAAGAGAGVDGAAAGAEEPKLLAEIYDGDGTFSGLDGAVSVFVSGTTSPVTIR